MLMEFFRKLNWTDILSLVVFVRIIFIGRNKGAGIEFFKVMGVCSAVVITLHYFSDLGLLFNQYVQLSPPITEITAMCFLWVLVIFLFKFIRNGVLLLIRAEAHPIINRWGTLLMGGFRAALIISMLLVGVNVSGWGFLQKRVSNSLSHRYLSNLAPAFYTTCFNGLLNKFFPNEQLNSRVTEVRQGKAKKPKK